MYTWAAKKSEMGPKFFFFFFFSGILQHQESISITLPPPTKYCHPNDVFNTFHIIFLRGWWATHPSLGVAVPLQIDLSYIGTSKSVSSNALILMDFLENKSQPLGHFSLHWLLYLLFVFLTPLVCHFGGFPSFLQFSRNNHPFCNIPTSLLF